MGAVVNVADLQFPESLAGRQRNAGTEITFDEVLIVVQPRAKKEL
jgi:hypothetical protein